MKQPEPMLPSNGDELLILKKSDVEDLVEKHNAGIFDGSGFMKALQALNQPGTFGTHSQGVKLEVVTTIQTLATAITDISNLAKTPGIQSAELDTLMNILTKLSDIMLRFCSLDLIGDSGLNADANFDSTQKQTVPDSATNTDDRWIHFNNHYWIPDPECKCGVDNTVIAYSENRVPYCRVCERAWQITLKKREEIPKSKWDFMMANLERILQEVIPGIPRSTADTIINQMDNLWKEGLKWK